MVEKEIIFVEKYTSTGYSDAFSNVNGNILTLQPMSDGTFSISLEGDINNDEENFTSITGVGMKGLRVVDKLSEAGVYQYDISGLKKIRLNIESNSGELTVKGVISNG